MKYKKNYTLFALLAGVIILFSSLCPAPDNGSGDIKVMIVTDYGIMKIRLYNQTPQHRDNFVKLISEHYYDSLLFHRVIRNFMIQGGDPDSKRAMPGEELGNGGPPYTIPAEFNPQLFHKKGALAAARDGARDLSLRSVAAEAGYAPAALYGYFANKDELLLALAAEDLLALARTVREEVQIRSEKKLRSAAAIVLDHLENTETFAAASSALPAHSGSGEAERLFNGRLIAVLTALSEAAGGDTSREGQCDVVLIGAALAGLALFARSGRLGALGFSHDELLARLERRFAR